MRRSFRERHFLLARTDQVPATLCVAPVVASWQVHAVPRDENDVSDPAQQEHEVRELLRAVLRANQQLKQQTAGFGTKSLAELQENQMSVDADVNQLVGELRQRDVRFVENRYEIHTSRAYATINHGWRRSVRRKCGAEER